MRFWHPYDHPNRLPDPDRDTALAAPLRAFPSWYIRTTCGVCGWERHASQTQILVARPHWEDRPIRDVLAAIRCNRCGSRDKAAAALVTHCGVGMAEAATIIPLGRENIP